MRSLIIPALLFTSIASVYALQSDSILRNRDFQKPPRQGVIANKDLQKSAQSLNRAEPADQIKVTPQRKVSFKDKQARKNSLLTRKAALEERITALQSKLDALNTRVLQNRPLNPLTVGDPYYVDPKLREQITLLKKELVNAQNEYQSIIDKLGMQ